MTHTTIPTNDIKKSNSTKAKELQQRTQGLMMFLGALADGLETISGKGADATCFSSGQMVGLAHPIQHTERSIDATLIAVRNEMQKMGIDWPFDSDYHHQHAPANNESTIDLPFKNCVVRCTLFRYGFPQGKSLCQTKHGLFCGLFERISGIPADLDIVHPGENACLLRLKIHSTGQN
jgi:hypothetical protein